MTKQSTLEFNIIIQNERFVIIKTRLFCRYLKGPSLWIVYAFYCESCKIDFIEIYFKNEKENRGGDRIKEYLKNF